LLAVTQIKPTISPELTRGKTKSKPGAAKRLQWTTKRGEYGCTMFSEKAKIKNVFVSIKNVFVSSKNVKIQNKNIFQPCAFWQNKIAFRFNKHVSALSTNDSAESSFAR
jgi:hypothetical protein